MNAPDSFAAPVAELQGTPRALYPCPPALSIGLLGTDHQPAAPNVGRPRLPVIGDNPAARQVAPSLDPLPAPGPMALCLLRGPGYVVELFNPVAARVWGQPASQVLGRPFLPALPPSDRDRYAAACAAVWQSGQAVGWPELPVVTTSPAGSLEITYFSLSFQPFPAGDELVAGILLIAQEVTSLLQARQQVQELRVELAATTAGLADYVAELTQAAGSR